MTSGEPNAWAPSGDRRQDRPSGLSSRRRRLRGGAAVAACLAVVAVSFGVSGLKQDRFFAFYLGLDGCEDRAEAEAAELRSLARTLFGEAATEWEISSCESVPGVALMGAPAPDLDFDDAQALLSDAGCLRLETYPVGLTCFVPSQGYETEVEVIRQAPNGQGVELVGLYRSF